MAADVYIFGDSITWGAFDARGGWADRLKQHFMEKRLANIDSPETQVVNLGISGDTADDLARRIDSEIKSRQKRWASRDDIYVIAVGVNDSKLKGPDKTPLSTPDNYAKRLKEISKIVEKYSKNIVFIGLTPVVDSFFALSEDSVLQNSRVKQFNKTLEEFCTKYDYSMVKIYEEMSKLNLENLFPDGLHPDTEGHAWMYNKIQPILSELLEEK